MKAYAKDGQVRYNRKVVATYEGEYMFDNRFKVTSFTPLTPLVRDIAITYSTCLKDLAFVVERCMKRLDYLEIFEAHGCKMTAQQIEDAVGSYRYEFVTGLHEIGLDIINSTNPDSCFFKKNTYEIRSES